MQQRCDAGRIADGFGPRAFVIETHSDLLFHEVDQVEDEGCEFGVSDGCHIGRLRSVAMSGRLAAEGFTLVSWPRNSENN